MIDNDICKAYLERAYRLSKADSVPVEIMRLERMEHRGQQWLVELRALRVRLYLRGVDSWVEFCHGPDVEIRMRSYLDTYLATYARYAASHGTN